MSFLLAENTRLTGEIEVKRSRFLTLVARVNTPEEAREIINETKASMPDARHHCNAFIVSVAHAQPISHSSDDGEPSGTAGRPMLDILNGSELIDVVAVVTRYFGGTLLGTGGLVRAYGDAVRECIEGTSLYTRNIIPTWSTLLPHAEAGRYLSEFSAAGYTTSFEYLADGVLTTIASLEEKTLRDLVARLSSGKLSITPAGEQHAESYAGIIANGRPALLEK